MRRILDYFKLFLLLFGLVLASGFLGWLSNEEVNGEFTAIDGDSLKLGDREIRLFGIDAPEYQQTCTGGNGEQYACGKKSASYLRSLITRTEVECAGNETDKYGRLVAICYAGDLEINQKLVSEGWAVSFGAYENSEAEARRERRGVWDGGFDLPQNWRRDRKDKHTKSWLSSVFGW